MRCRDGKGGMAAVSSNIWRSASLCPTAIAETGSGKTLGFALPALQHVADGKLATILVLSRPQRPQRHQIAANGVRRALTIGACGCPPPGNSPSRLRQSSSGSKCERHASRSPSISHTEGIAIACLCCIPHCPRGVFFIPTDIRSPNGVVLAHSPKL